MCPFHHVHISKIILGYRYTLSFNESIIFRLIIQLFRSYFDCNFVMRQKKDFFLVVDLEGALGYIK